MHTWLEVLKITQSKITNCDALSNLTNLTSIQSVRVDIRDCKFASKLINLISIDLSCTKITSIECLNELTNLKECLLDKCTEIKDWNKLYLPQLQKLSVIGSFCDELYKYSTWSYYMYDKLYFNSQYCKLKNNHQNVLINTYHKYSSSIACVLL